MKLAFFGVGERAAPYLKYLGGREDVGIAAVCDPDPRAAESIAAGWQARIFPHFAPLLREVRPDGLFVCVPPRLQGEVLELAVELKVPFLVEPPGAPDFASARRLHQRLHANPLVCAVGHTARSIDLVHEAKEYLGISKVPLAFGWWLAGAAESPVEPDLVWANGCQLIDLLRYFCGEAEAAAALEAGRQSRSIMLRMANATAATLSVADYPVAEPRIELELVGEGWYFRFLQQFRVLRLAEREKTTIVRQTNQPHADHAAAFLRAVAANDPSEVICSYADAWQTMRICRAVEMAVEAKGWVRVGEVG